MSEISKLPSYQSFSSWEKEGWNQPDNPAFAAAREAMGHVRSYSEQLELAALTPHEELSSTSFCLASPDREYIVFSTNDEPFMWFNPCNNTSIQQTAIVGGAGDRNFTSPGGNRKRSCDFSVMKIRLQAVADFNLA